MPTTTTRTNTPWGGVARVEGIDLNATGAQGPEITPPRGATRVTVTMVATSGSWGAAIVGVEALPAGCLMLPPSAGADAWSPLPALRGGASQAGVARSFVSGTSDALAEGDEVELGEPGTIVEARIPPALAGALRLNVEVAAGGAATGAAVFAFDAPFDDLTDAPEPRTPSDSRARESIG